MGCHDTRIMDHYPVLMEEASDFLALKDNGVYVDATCGAGGHSAYILSRKKEIFLYAIDKDREAIEFTGSIIGRRDDFKLLHGGFEDMSGLMKSEGVEGLDGVLFDLGFSSRQIRDPERGLSFSLDGPLDMRFDRERSLTASEIINFWDRDSLVYIFEKYGEIINPRRVVSKIIDRRKRQRFVSTRDLSDFLAANFRERKRIHPATRFFMALRIAVNDELKSLCEGLSQSKDLLNEGGRIVVISFHSLEDRIVKRFFRDSPDLKVLTKRPVVAGKEEVEANPESRSAKLRAAEMQRADVQGGR